MASKKINETAIQPSVVNNEAPSVDVAAAVGSKLDDEATPTKPFDKDTKEHHSEEESSDEDESSTDTDTSSESSQEQQSPTVKVTKKKSLKMLVFCKKKSIIFLTK